MGDQDIGSPGRPVVSTHSYITDETMQTVKTHIL